MTVPKANHKKTGCGWPDPYKRQVFLCATRVNMNVRADVASYLTECDAVVRRCVDSDQPFKCLGAGHDARAATNLRQWWIIRVHREVHTTLLGDRNDPVKEVLERRPQLHEGMKRCR